MKAEDVTATLELALEAHESAVPAFDHVMPKC